MQALDDDLNSYSIEHEKLSLINPSIQRLDPVYEEIDQYRFFLESDNEQLLVEMFLFCYLYFLLCNL